MKHSENLNKLLSIATQEAQRLGNDQVTPEHLLLAILRMEKGEAYNALLRLHIDLSALKVALDQHLFREAPSTHQIPFSRATERLLRLAEVEANTYQQAQIGTLHLLLAILRERINFVAILLKQEYNTTYETLEALYPHPADDSYDIENEWEDFQIAGIDDDFIEQMTSKHEQAPQSSSNDTPMLKKYGTDLNQKAVEGGLDPVIGREKEIERIIQILSRRKKNNPILIGEPGVGKSAIVEGLAHQIQQGLIPSMRNKKIVALDLAALLAGATYRGQFEKRLKDVINELKKHPDIIIFLDEIHTMIGAGSAPGSLDAANILKPALARGEIQCIGATTINEYKQSIEKDGALERRFQKILVSSNNYDETLNILSNLKPFYENHHHVVYTEDALKACVEYTDRYVYERVQPDKAIDAMDEVGAYKALQPHHAQLPHLVTEEDVREIVSRMSNIPIKNSIAQNDTLRDLDVRLKQYVVGQDAAIDRVVRSIRASRLGLRDMTKPIASFFFLGATGVGKTYLAQCLAQELFGTHEAIIRLDMSEYSEKHAVSLLVGAPPGYIAHEQGGKLTEAVRRRPYSIILFDEIEKAHADIFNFLLQVLDEGHLTDRSGQKVDFRNTIIILTSNVGTKQLLDSRTNIGFEPANMTHQMEEKVLKKALQNHFPSEFVGRLGDIITFNKLSIESITRILDMEVDKIANRLAQRGYALELNPNIRKELVDKLNSPSLGARLVKKVVQQELEDQIINNMLQHPENMKILIYNN